MEEHKKNIWVITYASPSSLYRGHQGQGHVPIEINHVAVTAKTNHVHIERQQPNYIH